MPSGVADWPSRIVFRSLAGVRAPCYLERKGFSPERDVRVLVVENYVATPLGLVGQALVEASAEIDLRQAWLGAPLPADHAGYDGIVILGGAQSAVDDDDHPYLPEVAALARGFGKAEKAVLGICLGAQLVARGYGGKNILGRPIEFGWHCVLPTAAGRDDGDGAAGRSVQPCQQDWGEGHPDRYFRTGTGRLFCGAHPG
ncbi:MAG: hypothetical protein WD036_10130 [Bauldia sp.]